MAAVHARSPSAESVEARAAKKTKTEHVASLAERLDPTPRFATGLFDSAQGLHKEYKNSGPYLHAKVDQLFQDDLLTKVKDEIIGQLSFMEKETDIYKVHQTGDLASLSYLDEAQLALLPNLLVLRDALYSPQFRNFIREVTGCGPLSGIKTDMSVNSYKKGCHLLNHDDVIGSRRVSYILYMPLPKDEEWKPEWGGALELYPVKDGADGVPEPECIPSKVIPPSWNQFVFFEVQPGHSFHSVEEVIVDEDGKNRQRLSISGWFHKAQEGEEGYEPEPEEKQKSSLEQLTSTSTTLVQYPPDVLKATAEEPLTQNPLSKDDIAFLSKYLNPIYLQERTLDTLAKKFTDESSCELHSPLREDIAKDLEAGLREQDQLAELDSSREGRIPPHDAGIGKDSDWNVRGPPHKARFCMLRESIAELSETVEETYAKKASRILYDLQHTLFPSSAFRAWLARATSLIPLAYDVQARRFRPGLDYTLATGTDEDSRLDVVLGLTPGTTSTTAENKGKGKATAKEEAKPLDWEDGEWGGWECYMAPHDGEEDPAVYRSGTSKSKQLVAAEKPKDKQSSSKKAGDDDERMDLDDVSDSDINTDEDDEDEDSGTLLTVQPGFNRLLLVLRDEGVMRFVKYISASAPGSRFDICAEFEVGMVEDDGDGDVKEEETEKKDKGKGKAKVSVDEKEKEKVEKKEEKEEQAKKSESKDSKAKGDSFGEWPDGKPSNLVAQGKGWYIMSLPMLSEDEAWARGSRSAIPPWLRQKKS